MKQVIQNYKTGALELAEVPVPRCKSGGVLVRNQCSAISVGTERLMLSTAKKSLVKKALDRPDLVRKVMNLARTEGIAEAYRQSMNRLDDPVPLGYSCAGVVEDVGNGVLGIQQGDRVACFGSGYASHAEYVWIPKNLMVHIPENVSMDEAAFAGIGAIALHAIRLAETSIGERVAVTGVGLIGLLAVQILKALNCRVLAVDVSESQLKLAKELGSDCVVNAADRADVIQAARDISEGYGVDTVLVYASGGGKDAVAMYAEMARDRGKIVIPGVVDMEVPRKDFFEKELQLIVARSAGPGIFDDDYEVKGRDYPIGYVRWSEQRNLQSFLELVQSGKVDISRLITHRFSLDEAEQAYELLVSGKERVLGALFQYPNHSRPVSMQDHIIPVLDVSQSRDRNKTTVIGLIGAGLFSKTTLLPLLAKMKNVRLKWVATTKGFTADHVAKKFGCEYETTDYQNVLNDEEVDAVMVLTRHDSHARFVAEAIEAGKHVYVEKPLAITVDQLNLIHETYKRNQKGLIMVGFNRRFSPHALFLRKELEKLNGPFVVTCRVNAGYAEKDSWVLDPESGGGRIVGEACHFIDLVQYLTGELVTSIYAETIEGKNGFFKSDNLVLTLRLSNGSVGTIIYYANGNKRFPREYVEVSGNGAVGCIVNFSRSRIVKGPRTRTFRTLGVDRGHKAEMEQFISGCLSGVSPIPYLQIYQTSLASIIGESLPSERVELNLVGEPS